MKRHFWLLLAWLFEHEPVRCAVCFRWLWHKDAVYKQITTGGTAPLCPECDRAIFRPFTKAQRN
jgi:hypothetical protein